MNTFVVLFALFICTALSTKFKVTYYQTTDCSGTSTWTATAADDGSCTAANNNDAFVIVQQSGSGYRIDVYSDSACILSLYEIILTKSQFNKCNEILVLSFSFGSLQFQQLLSCFPEDAVLKLDSGLDVEMKNLMVGDKVQTKHGFSEVYAFLDKKPNDIKEFEDIYFVDENDEVKNIRLTSEHLILAKRGELKEAFVQAEDVQVGDFIYRQMGETTRPTLVLSKKTVEAKGAYTPATLDGTIVVDGIVVSSYAVVDHNIAHAVLAPLRWTYSISPSFVSSQENGIHPYANWFFQTFSSWLTEKNSFYSCPKLTATTSQ